MRMQKWNINKQGLLLPPKAHFPVKVEEPVRLIRTVVKFESYNNLDTWIFSPVNLLSSESNTFARLEKFTPFWKSIQSWHFVSTTTGLVSFKAFIKSLCWSTVFIESFFLFFSVFSMKLEINGLCFAHHILQGYKARDRLLGNYNVDHYKHHSKQQSVD